MEFEQLGVTLHQIDRRFLGGLGDLPGDRLRFDAAFIGDPVAELREDVYKRQPQTFAEGIGAFVVAGQQQAFRGFRGEQGESRIGQAGIQQQAHEGRLGPGLGRNPQHVVAPFQ